MAKCDLTAQLLRAVLHYDPHTGIFIWKVRTSRRTTVGHKAGYFNVAGYCYISVCNGKYLAHRLAWLYVHSDWPSGQIDHQDGNRCNNRIDNLRDVSHTVNAQNIRGPSKNNLCGFLGVTWRPTKQGNWRTTIRTAGKQIALGQYATPELAHAAYIDAKRRLHLGCTI